MALKLKLKVPSKNGDSSSSPPLPKLKIKAPSKDKGISKPSGPKLKINLSHKKPIETSVSASPVIPAVPKIPKALPKVRIKPTRIPGDGYDAEAPDVEDDPLIEQGIVLRFLDDSNLDFVQNSCETGDLSNVNIKWITRDKAVVNVNQTLYSARLIDLPTITEIYKTVDKKNIFKTFDVCQILLVLQVIDPTDLNVDRDFEIPPESTYVHPLYSMSPDNEIKPSKVAYKDGLVYPFEQVHRRFRPRKVNHRVMDDIDARVNKLVKEDSKAEESHYELVDAAQAHPSHRYGAVGSGQSGSATPVPVAEQEMDTMAHDLENDVDLLESALQEELAALGNDEDEEEDEDKADEGTSDVDNLFEGDVTGAEEEEEEEDDDEEEEEEDDEEDETLKAENSRAKKLEEEISDLESALSSQKQQLENAKNKMLQMKLQSNCNTLRGQIEVKRRLLFKIRDEQQKLQEKLEPNHKVEPENNGAGEVEEGEEGDEGDDGDGDDDDDDDDNLEGLF